MKIAGTTTPAAQTMLPVATGDATAADFSALLHASGPVKKPSRMRATWRPPTPSQSAQPPAQRAAKPAAQATEAAVSPEPPQQRRDQGTETPATVSPAARGPVMLAIGTAPVTASNAQPLRRAEAPPPQSPRISERPLQDAPQVRSPHQTVREDGNADLSATAKIDAPQRENGVDAPQRETGVDAPQRENGNPKARASTEPAFAVAHAHESRAASVGTATAAAAVRHTDAKPQPGPAGLQSARPEQPLAVVSGADGARIRMSIRSAFPAPGRQHSPIVPSAASAASDTPAVDSIDRSGSDAARTPPGASAAGGLSVSSTQTAPFRSEAAADRAAPGEMPAAQADEPQATLSPMPDPGHPPLATTADVVISLTGMAAIDITLEARSQAAADRLQGETAGLQAELVALGTEVEAIRVELRSDRAPDAGVGGSATGWNGQGNPGDHGMHSISTISRQPSQARGAADIGAAAASKVDRYA